MQLQGRKSTLAAVDKNGALLVNGVARGSYVQEALVGNAYVAQVATVTPTGANDCFLFVSNLGSDPLVISRLTLTSAAGEDMYIDVGPAYTPVGGTSAVQQNKYVGSPNTSDAVVQYGVNITGLVLAQEIARYTLGGAGSETWTDGSFLPLVLGPGQCMSVFAGTGTSPLTFIVLDYYFVATPAAD